MSKIPQLLGGRRLAHDFKMEHGVRALFGMGSQTIAMADIMVTLVIGPPGTGQTEMKSNVLNVDPESGQASEILLMPAEADMKGLLVVINNTGGEAIVVKDDSNSTTIVTIDANQSGIVTSDGTTLFGFTGTDGGADDFGSTGIKTDLVEESTVAAGITTHSRLTGFNSLSTRYELKWVAGQRGKPGINGDIQSATEAVRMIADPDFEITGTNSTSALSTFNAEGGITLTTAGADGDEMILTPHLDANQSAWTQVTWGTDKSVIWECHIKSGASVTNAIIWAGLKLTSAEAKATDDDQVFFRFEDDVASGNWEVVSSIGGTDTSTDSSVAVAVNTEYHLKIVISAARTAACYLNGVLVYTTAALTDTTDLIPYVGVAADGAAAAKAISVYGKAISRTAG